MRSLRIGITAVFLLSLIAFVAVFLLGTGKTDSSAPVITADADTVSVSVGDDGSALLAGLTAADAKDGDLTDKIYVDSRSGIENGKVRVTFAVCDSDNNVAKFVRTVEYTDYKPPMIYLKQPLRFSNREKFSVLDSFGAEDVFDGDISSKIRLTASDITARSVGEYSVTVDVTNSLGDRTELQTEVFIDSYSAYRPTINLKDPYVTVPVGGTLPDLNACVSSVTGAGGSGTVENPSVVIDSRNVDVNTPGAYTVTFSYVPEGEAKSEANTAEATLVVIVR